MKEVIRTKHSEIDLDFTVRRKFAERLTWIWIVALYQQMLDIAPGGHGTSGISVESHDSSITASPITSKIAKENRSTQGNLGYSCCNISQDGATFHRPESADPWPLSPLSLNLSALTTPGSSEKILSDRSNYRGGKVQRGCLLAPTASLLS